MKSIYVGCSLYDASEEFKASVEELKNSLRNEFHVLDFMGKNNGSPEEIVRHDLSQLRAADYFVAICDFPSTGLGIEIGTANALAKPTLLCAGSENISNMVRGNREENDRAVFFQYDNFEQLKEKITDFAK